MAQSKVPGYDVKPSEESTRDTTVTVTCDKTYFELSTNQHTIGIPRQHAMEVLAKAFEEETSTS